jgi:galactoside O-acetyltransferase
MLARIKTRLSWYIRRAMLTRATIGARSYVGKGADFTGCRVAIGDDVFANQGLLIEGDGHVTIGHRVRIGPRVTIITSSHHLTDDPERRASHELFTKPVRIADGAWIGASATLLPGVSIGQGSVVAAGAVVTKDVPAGVIVAGMPAKIIKTFTAGSSRQPANG